MTQENINQVSRVSSERQTAFVDSLEATQEASASLDANLKANQMDASKDKLQSEAEDNSALGIAIRTKKLDRPQTTTKTEKAKKVQESVLVRKEDADSLADQFSRRQGNQEYRLNPATLSQMIAEELGVGINEDSEPDIIIALIRKRMIDPKGQPPDAAIVDKAFEFLLEATQVQFNRAAGADKLRLEKIHKRIETAKNQNFEANKIEIQVAQKIIGAVDAVVQTTGQTVKEALDHYRDIVHNPPDLQVLRKFYETKGYKAMFLELKGLNSYLGGNLKRTNLENPELAQLAAAARKMQALLGVFRQSKAHVPTMEHYLVLNRIIAA